METTKPSECCGKPENMKVIESSMGRTVMQCSVCGRKHYEVVADPGTLFAKSA